MKSCLFIFLSILSIGFSEKVAKNRPNFGNTCSRGCFCESVYSVRFQNGALDDIPNDLSPALTRLDLQRNRLFQVSSIINSYGKLQFLRLNQNNIGSLNSKNFDRLNYVSPFKNHASKKSHICNFFPFPIGILQKQ